MKASKSSGFSKSGPWTETASVGTGSEGLRTAAEAVCGIVEFDITAQYDRKQEKNVRRQLRPEASAFLDVHCLVGVQVDDHNAILRPEHDLRLSFDVLC
jgi:hypothetical protein